MAILARIASRALPARAANGLRASTTAAFASSGRRFYSATPLHNPSTMTPPPFTLAGKLVVLTGASRGLGLVMGQAIVASGADLAMVDLNKEEAQEQATLMVETYKELYPGQRVPRVTAHYANVADESSVDGCIQEVLESQAAAAADGTTPDDIVINGLVTSAGFVENVPAIDYPPARMRALWGVNVDGTYLFATAVARHLHARALQQQSETGIATSGTGSMVLVGSMSGAVVNVPQPQAPYNASKAAVRQLAASLAVEWAPAGIRVNCMSPGYMETPLTAAILADQPALRQQWTSGVPQGRLGVPSDLAGPVVFLLSDAAKYVTGADLRVDGGYTII
ncbi:d-arabinitol dehydrogenase [Ophiostoma piceae UAMH 11346]|uniref:D-arabinitol dehydrogenase n=1 Tax=Ophiostoma piceae (strain UAMH 11346) TaxID=1262450 RepID=S3C3A5_OPHP1|nr:d-arabinitol dehydrogenase [Ophiostoma piceae UAMH 11346]